MFLLIVATMLIADVSSLAFNVSCHYMSENKLLTYYTNDTTVVTEALSCIPATANENCHAYNAYKRNTCSATRVMQPNLTKTECIFEKPNKKTLYKFVAVKILKVPAVNNISLPLTRTTDNITLPLTRITDKVYFPPWKNCDCIWDDIIRPIKIRRNGNRLSVIIRFHVNHNLYFVIKNSLTLYASSDTPSYENKTYKIEVSCDRKLEREVLYSRNITCDDFILKSCYKYTLCLNSSYYRCLNKHTVKCYKVPDTAYPRPQISINVSCRRIDTNTYAFQWQDTPLVSKSGYYYKYLLNGESFSGGERFQRIGTTRRNNLIFSNISSSFIRISVCLCYCTKCGHFFTAMCPTVQQGLEVSIILYCITAIICLLLVWNLCFYFRKKILSRSNNSNTNSDDLATNHNRALDNTANRNRALDNTTNHNRAVDNTTNSPLNTSLNNNTTHITRRSSIESQHSVNFPHIYETVL